MQALVVILTLLAAVAALIVWYRYEYTVEANATVRLQSEHEHFHLHVDLPPDLIIQPGDTLHLLTMPQLDTGRTNGGELSYESRVRLHKASWLRRRLTMSSSIVEVAELVDHP